MFECCVCDFPSREYNGFLSKSGKRPLCYPPLCSALRAKRRSCRRACLCPSLYKFPHRRLTPTTAWPMFLPALKLQLRIVLAQRKATNARR